MLDTTTTYCNALDPTDCSVHNDWEMEIVWEMDYTFTGTRSEVEDIIDAYLDTEDFDDDFFVGASLYMN